MSDGSPGASRNILRLLLVLWCAATAAAQGTRDDAYQGRVPFSHFWHVPAEWRTVRDRLNDAGNPDEARNRARLLGETPRDCRGCHGYEAGKERDPQQVCAACHYLPGTIDLTALPGFAKDLGPLRRLVTPFTHREHLAIGCRACHEPPGDRIALPSRIPVLDGTALCFRCHRDRDPDDPRTRNWAPNQRFEWLRSPEAPDGGHGRFLERLNRDPSMGPDGFAPFFHKDHIAPANRTGTTDCAGCHGTVKSADAGALASATVGADSLGVCKSCHRTNEPGVAIDFAVVDEPRTSPAAGAFHHVDHYAPKDPANQKELSGACTGCHQYRAGVADDEYPLGAQFPERRAYQGCIGCHYHQARHTVADHGTVAACVPCHTLGSGAMKRNLPTVAVARARPAWFLADAQTHPFLTAGNGAPDPTCARCHRADLERLPSRIDARSRRRFDHQSHLPPRRTAADCEPCHPAIRTSSGPEAILATYGGPPGAAAGPIAQPDPAVCGRCHTGSVLVAQADPAAPAVPAARVRFPHDVHLRPRTRAQDQLPRLDCLTCHVPDTRRGTDVGTTTEALTCQPCHQHEGWQAAITGGKDRAYVTTCVQCHEGRGGVVPADDAVVQVRTARVRGVRNTQFHPRGDACERCHVGAEETLRKPESHLSAQLARVHKKEGRDPDPRTTDCLVCHWDLNIASALESAANDPRFVAFQRTQSKSTGSSKLQIRSFFGGNLDGYPGRGPAR